MRALAPLIACATTACASGQSILNAGNEPTTTVVVTTTPTTSTVPATATPGETLPPTTTTSTTAPPTTTTTPLAALPPCRVEALEESSEPIELVFWHGLGTTLEETLAQLTDDYNASQSRVHVQLENQGGYRQTIDKYFQSGQDSRPNIVMMPEYMLKQTADSDSIVPVGACFEASDFDATALLPRVLKAYETEGVQWAMPFNVSVPILYYNKSAFRGAGLDPEVPPSSIDDLRTYSQAIVDAGPGVGIALDSGVDSGGGWFLEQWFAQAGQYYADNENGRVAPATRVLYDGPAGVELLTPVQALIMDGLAVTVGDNPNGQDALLRMADPAQPAAMAIASSAGLGTVISVLDGGLIPGITSTELGVGPMPGPGETRSALVGGASLYIVADKGDAATAAAWDYISYLVKPESQATWAGETGYVPVREDALDLEPLRSAYAQDPRRRVAYDELIAGAEGPAGLGPVLGPLREVRSVTAGAVAQIFGGADVQSSLSAAAAQSNALIADYAARN
jgi:sn-glycerol 3-phosphate transport system substrate-binding protein